MLKKTVRFVAPFTLLAILAAISFGSNGDRDRKARGDENPVTITVVPWGPSQADVDAARKRVERSKAVRGVLEGTNYRSVGLEYIENLDETTKTPLPPVRFRVIFYDYTNDRTYFAEADLAGKGPVVVTQEAFDPRVGSEELKAAFDVVRGDAEFGKLAASGSLEMSGAMPPTSNINGERLVNLEVKDSSRGVNQIVGVSFKNSKIVRYDGGAPSMSRAAATSCGFTNSGQGSTSRGVPGQYLLTVTGRVNTGYPRPKSNKIWEMLITRPSASSGTSGSGIDLQNVKRLGRSVFKRAHAPVLNVKYGDNVCGPYLDWQYAEGFFNVPAAGATYPNGPDGGIAVLAPGQTATTFIESQNDTGNFQGVAIYRQNNETVLVTEMNAGWYRYAMEWRFADDGTIRPRYGFGATSNACVCFAHYHHVYWRFDFDVINPNNNVYQIEGPQNIPQQVLTESSIFRNYATNRRLLVQNSIGPEGYMLTPNATDGAWDNGDPSFGAGDMWVLKTAPDNGELGVISGNALDMSSYLNGEAVSNTDVTVWYAGHFAHIDGDRPLKDKRGRDVLSGDHVVGPDIAPVGW